jgi:SAM-dependent methyltransferase
MSMDNYQYVASWVSRRAAAREPAKVLDFGCGRGTVVKLLRDQGLDCYGCDAFVKSTLAPRDYVLEPAWFGSVVREMEGGAIPFAADTFDIVVNNQVMEHVEDMDRVLAEIHRVLKPGGRVLSLFPDRSVWREGHCGVAFLHWFPKRSKAQLYYATFWRALGFGYHKEKLGSISAWAHNRCQYLDEQTFYRSLREVHRLYSKYFCNITHWEASYFRDRFGGRIPVLGSLPDALLVALVRVAAGCVFTCEKPPTTGHMSPQSPCLGRLRANPSKDGDAKLPV